MYPLVDAGLLELNLSTGDAHQQYVPWERVLTAGIAAAEAGLLTLITVESTSTSRFTIWSAYRDPRLERFVRDSPARSRLLLMSSLWVDFSKEPDSSAARPGRVEQAGCDNLFDTIVFAPDGATLACCGLPAGDIPEMSLGNPSTCEDLRASYLAQFEDFAKLWLWLDGPHKICREVATAGELGVPAAATHPCHVCKLLFRSEPHREVLRRIYADHVPEVLFRLSIRSRLMRLQEASAASPCQ